jgi:hypothetical protein
MQQEDKVDQKDYLALYYREKFAVTTYLDDKHSFFSLEGITESCIPTVKNSVMFKFPFNANGSELEGYLNDGSFHFWFDVSQFCAKHNYVLPDTYPKRPKNRSLVRENTEHMHIYDGSALDYKEYQGMINEPNGYLGEQTIALWGR